MYPVKRSSYPVKGSTSADIQNTTYPVKKVTTQPSATTVKKVQSYSTPTGTAYPAKYTAQGSTPGSAASKRYGSASRESYNNGYESPSSDRKRQKLEVPSTQLRVDTRSPQQPKYNDTSSSRPKSVTASSPHQTVDSLLSTNSKSSVQSPHLKEKDKPGSKGSEVDTQSSPGFKFFGVLLSPRSDDADQKVSPRPSSDNKLSSRNAADNEQPSLRPKGDAISAPRQKYATKLPQIMNTDVVPSPSQKIKTPLSPRTPKIVAQTSPRKAVVAHQTSPRKNVAQTSPRKNDAALSTSHSQGPPQPCPKGAVYPVKSPAGKETKPPTSAKGGSYPVKNPAKDTEPSTAPTPRAPTNPSFVPGLTLYLPSQSKEKDDLLTLFESCSRSKISMKMEITKDTGTANQWTAKLLMNEKCVSTGHGQGPRKSRYHAALKAMDMLPKVQPCKNKNANEEVFTHPEKLKGLTLYKPSGKLEKDECLEVVTNSCMKCGLPMTWWDDGGGKVFGPGFSTVLLISGRIICWGFGEDLDEARKETSVKALEKLQRQPVVIVPRLVKTKRTPIKGAPSPIAKSGEGKPSITTNGIVTSTTPQPSSVTKTTNSTSTTTAYGNSSAQTSVTTTSSPRVASTATTKTTVNSISTLSTRGKAASISSPLKRPFGLDKSPVATQTKTSIPTTTKANTTVSGAVKKPASTEAISEKQAKLNTAENQPTSKAAKQPKLDTAPPPAESPSSFMVPIPQLKLYLPHSAKINESDDLENPRIILLESCFKSKISVSYKYVYNLIENQSEETKPFDVKLKVEDKTSEIGLTSSGSGESKKEAGEIAAQKAIRILRKTQQCIYSEQIHMHLQPDERIENLTLYLSKGKPLRQLLHSCERCSLPVTWWDDEAGGTFGPAWTAVLSINSKVICWGQAATLEKAKEDAASRALTRLKKTQPVGSNKIPGLVIYVATPPPTHKPRAINQHAKLTIQRSCTRCNITVTLKIIDFEKRLLNKEEHLANLLIGDVLVASGYGKTVTHARWNAWKLALDELMETQTVVYEYAVEGGSEKLPQNKVSTKGAPQSSVTKVMEPKNSPISTPAMQIMMNSVSIGSEAAKKVLEEKSNLVPTPVQTTSATTMIPVTREAEQKSDLIDAPVQDPNMSASIVMKKGTEGKSNLTTASLSDETNDENLSAEPEIVMEVTQPRVNTMTLRNTATGSEQGVSEGERMSSLVIVPNLVPTPNLVGGQNMVGAQSVGVPNLITVRHLVPVPVQHTNTTRNAKNLITVPVQNLYKGCTTTVSAKSTPDIDFVRSSTGSKQNDSTVKTKTFNVLSEWKDEDLNLYPPMKSLNANSDDLIERYLQKMDCF